MKASCSLVPTACRKRSSHPRGRIAVAAILGCTALTSPLWVTPAHAQDAEATVDDDVIIVTAQRRSEALEDVPMTVNVLSQETLANAGVTSVRDLSAVTTGYQLANAGSVPQPSVRGVTSLINGAYENNVAVYIDGLYQTVPAAINIDLPNIANVQVLKGPQGTLYGRNATGGAILVETISAGDSWIGQAELTYARFDDKRASGYVAGPLSDTLALPATFAAPTATSRS
jgi:iron complex outermembrane recepter protein